MSAPAIEPLWLRLKAEGLVTGELPPAGPTGSPWFVRVMMGVAAWIASSFLLAFVGAFVAGGSSATFLTIGLVACTAATVLLRRAPETAEFATQLGLVVSLAGQGSLLIALGDLFDGRISVIAPIMLCLVAALFATVPNFIHRVLSAACGGVAVMFLLADWQLPVYAPVLISAGYAWTWLHEFQYVRHGRMLRAAGYGLVLALIAALISASLGEIGSRIAGGAPRPWEGHRVIAAALNGVVLLWAVRGLLAREGVAMSSRAGMYIVAAAGVLALTALEAPGLAPAVLILIVGYGNGNRVLLGLGVAVLLGYLSLYYYSLETTLLYKSALIGATGLALLIARLILGRVWRAEPLEGQRQ